MDIDKSLIEKLDGTEKDKLNKFIKTLNEINDSSAKKKIIELLNSIEQDIYTLDSLNSTNNDMETKEFQKNFNELIKPQKQPTESPESNIKPLGINDKYKNNSDLEQFKLFKNYFENLYSILINLNQSSNSFINNINDLFEVLTNMEEQWKKYLEKNTIVFNVEFKKIPNFFKRDCYLDTKLRSQLYMKRKKRFNKYIHRMESDDKISINIFCSKYETMLELEKFYHYVYNRTIIDDYNLKLDGTDTDNAIHKINIIDKIKLLDKIYEILEKITHDPVLKTINTLFFDIFKIKDNSRYYSILSIPDANNDKLFLFDDKDKLSLTSLLDTLKKIKEKLLPSSNQTTSNNLTEVTKIISDLFSIDSKKNSDDLIGIFEEYRKETNKKINSITGGIGNEEYSKFLNIACKNKFFEIKDLDNAFQSSQLAGGNNINDNLSNSYSKYCGLEFLFIQCLLLLKLLKLETSVEKQRLQKKIEKELQILCKIYKDNEDLLASGSSTVLVVAPEADPPEADHFDDKKKIKTELDSLKSKEESYKKKLFDNLLEDFYSQDQVPVPDLKKEDINKYLIIELLNIIKENISLKGGENIYRKQLEIIDDEYRKEKRNMMIKNEDEGDKNVKSFNNEQLETLKNLDFRDINNLNISDLRKKIYKIKNKDFIVQTEITNQDIYIFIAVIYIIRVVALYIVMWFIEIEMFKDNESVIVGYIFIYLFCFFLIFAFVNISDNKMNDTKGLLYYFYNRVNTTDYTRFIIHIGILLLILVIPFIIRITDNEPSTYKNINDNKKRNLYKFITNLSTVIWIVLSIMAFLFR